MERIEIIVALITVIGVVLTAFVTWSIAQRRIAVEHVTAERTKWREKVRTLALQVHDALLSGDTASIGRLQSEFSALLNPVDRDDQAILDCMTLDESSQEREERAIEFARRISLLLKHDWDRAKLEAGFFLRRWLLNAKRHKLKSAVEESCGRRTCKKLRWWEKYEINWLGALFLAAAVVVGIWACRDSWFSGPSVP